MNKYSKRILELRDELLGSIKAIMRNNGLDEISVSDCCDKTIVPWWNNKDYLCEGQVIMVCLTDNGLSILLDSEDFCQNIELFEDSFALENPVYLNNIRDNIIEALSDLHEHVCYECGKPVDEDSLIRDGKEEYCSDECLSRNNTLEYNGKANEG